MIRRFVLLALLLVAAPAFGGITVVRVEAILDESNQTTTEVEPDSTDSLLADDDVIVLAFCKDDNPSVNCTADGFVIIDEGSWSGGGQLNASLWSKVVTNAAGEPDTYTCTHDSEMTAYVTLILRGVEPTDQFSGASTEYMGNNDSTPEHPEVTTADDCAFVVASFCQGQIIQSPVTHPSGTDERADIDATNNSAVELALATFVQTSLGGTGVQEWTTSNVDMESGLHMQAFRPAVEDCSAPAGRDRRQF